MYFQSENNGKKLNSVLILTRQRSANDVRQGIREKFRVNGGIDQHNARNVPSRIQMNLQAPQHAAAIVGGEDSILNFAPNEQGFVRGMKRGSTRIPDKPDAQMGIAFENDTPPPPRQMFIKKQVRGHAGTSRI